MASASPSQEASADVSRVRTLERELEDLKKNYDHLKARTTALETEKQAQESSLTTAWEALDRDLQAIAETQAEEDRREAKNRKRSARLKERKTLLAKYKVRKHQEIAELKAKIEQLSAEKEGSLGLHEAELATKNKAIESVHARYREMADEHDEMIVVKDNLVAVRDDLREVNTSLIEENAHLRDDLTATQAEIQRLTKQLQSCHCSGGRLSLKRRYSIVDLEEEELPSEDEAYPRAKRHEKAAEISANLDAVRQSLAIRTVEESVGSERSTSRGNEISHPTGPSSSNAGPLMNTTASRALGTLNPTISPSSGVAFTISVKDVKLLNFSSDVLPHDILQELRRKFRLWTANSAFNWATVQSSTRNLSRNCIEARLERHKARWDDGLEYACAVCNHRRRLCVVVDSEEEVMMLPRKAAEDDGKSPTEAGYWMR